MRSQCIEKRGSENTHKNVAAYHQLLHMKVATLSLSLADAVMPDRGHANDPLHPFSSFIPSDHWC